MTEDRPARSSAAELLDTGGGRGWSWARRRTVLVVVLALLGTAAVVLLEREPPRSIPGPSPARSSGTASEAPVVLRRTGPVPTGLGPGTLYLRSTDTVFRVDLGSGRVTATPAPVPTTAASFVAGPWGVLVRPADDSPGLLVPDDGAARPLAGLLSSGAQVLPATRGRLWVSELVDARSSTFLLTSVDGTPTGTALRENGYFLPDGSGGLLLVDSGGLWERVDGSWNRLGIGTALGTGPRHHLLATCAGDVFCETVTLVRYDRERRTRETVLASSDLQLPGGGTLSADGRFLATPTADEPDADGNARALVLELGTARVVKQMVVPASAPGVTAVAAWSLDGRRLVGLDQGQLFVLDPASGTTTRPDLGLPADTQLVQLALRAGSSR